jgi:hypothetical protein
MVQEICYFAQSLPNLDEHLRKVARAPQRKVFSWVLGVFDPMLFALN